MADIFITISTSFIYGVDLAMKLQSIIYTAWSTAALFAFLLDSTVLGIFGMKGLVFFIVAINLIVIMNLDRFPQC